MAMQLGSAARVASLARASGVALGGFLGVDAGAGVDAGGRAVVASAISRAWCMVSGPSPMPMARMVWTPAAWARARTSFAVFGVEVEVGVGVYEHVAVPSPLILCKVFE